MIYRLEEILPKGLQISALVISLLLAFLGSGCGKQGPALGPGAGSSTFQSTGEIRVAVVPAPPITAIEPNSKKPEGYAVDVMDAIAKKAQLRVTYLPSDWATMGAALASRKADVVIGPIFMTEGRAREYAFTDSLFAYAVVAILPSQSEKVRTVEDLQAPGLRIAVGRGGFDSEFVANSMPRASVSAFPPDDPNLPMLEILAGRADVALADHATAMKFVAEHPETKIGFNGEPLSLQYAAFMLRHEDLVLRDFLNLAIRNLDLSGALHNLDAKYANNRAWYARVAHRPDLVR